jgi:hypothetical protein
MQLLFFAQFAMSPTGLENQRMFQWLFYFVSLDEDGGKW